MFNNYVISSLDELVIEDVVEIEGFGSRVFAVSQITSLSEFKIEVGFSCLYPLDFDEIRMDSNVFHLNSLYGNKIEVFNPYNYSKWKYKTQIGGIKHLIDLPKGL